MNAAQERLCAFSWLRYNVDCDYIDYLFRSSYECLDIHLSYDNF